MKYTLEDIQEMYESGVTLQGVQLYVSANNHFVTFTNENTAKSSHRCKEIAASSIRRNLLENPSFYKYIGVTRVVSTKNSEVALTVSSRLYDLEAKFGIKPHKLRCLFYKNKKTVCWQFELDDEWFAAPPVAHYWMRTVRLLFKGTAKPQRKVINKLLELGIPSELFGKNRQNNWLKTSDFGAQRWSGVYGDSIFGSNVRTKKEQHLRDRYPDNKIFDMPFSAALAPSKVSQNEVLQVSCPHCKRPAHLRCKTKGGGVAREYHADRHKAALIFLAQKNKDKTHEVTV